MVEDLSFWEDETIAMGNPADYRKADLEMWVKRLFDKFDFKAGRSNRERRHSFEEIWEASNGNTEAIAYGFNAALKTKTYSLMYVKSCVKNFGVIPPSKRQDDKPKETYKFNMPIIKPDPPKFPERKTRKPKIKTNEPIKKVEIDWS